MKRLKSGVIALIFVGIIAGALGFAAWWIRREPTPSTAMESVISYWEKWSEDVVRERVRNHMESASSPSVEEMQGAAETVGGAYSIAMYKKAVEKAPDRATLRLGLIRRYCSSSMLAQEVVLTSYTRTSGDPVEENLLFIQEELDAAEKVDPDNACIDYLRAYLALCYENSSTDEVLLILDDTLSKTVFDDYSLDAAKNQANLLIRTGFPDKEAKFSVIQESHNPLRTVWAEVGDRLEKMGRRYMLEKDSEKAEDAFLLLEALGVNLATTHGWLNETLNGYQLQMTACRALMEINKADKERIVELKEKEKLAREYHSSLRPFQMWHGRHDRLRILDSDEFGNYLDVFLTHGAAKANRLLMSRQM